MYVYTYIIFCRKTSTRKAMGWMVCVWWNPLQGMLWSQDGHHVAVDFGKHPFSRELDLGTDTRGTWAIIPGKPQDQSNGLFESCAEWRNADERDFSKETCHFHRFVVSPGEEMWLCWKPAVLFFFIFLFLSILFWRFGGDGPEMKHFILVSLTGLGNASFFWLDWFQINSEHNSASLGASAALTLFLYCGCALRRTSMPRRLGTTFGWVHRNSINLGAWLHGPKKSIQQL